MIGWRFTEPSPLRQMLETVLEEERRQARAGRGEPMPMNARDTGDAIVIQASLPGVRPEDVHLECSENLLTIRAASRVEEHDYMHQEMRSTQYLRQVSLPGEVRCESAQAESSDGILTVTVPKVKPKAPDKIRIQVTSKSSGATTVDATPGTDYSEVKPPTRTRRRRL